MVQAAAGQLMNITEIDVDFTELISTTARPLRLPASGVPFGRHTNSMSSRPTDAQLFGGGPHR